MRTEEEAVAMIDPRNLDTLLHPQFDTAALKAATPIGKGLGASPGAACGKIVFTAEDAEEWHARGERVVLVRLETSPEDITGMKASQGILTVRGGTVSYTHLDVYKRQVVCWGKIKLYFEKTEYFRIASAAECSTGYSIR